MNNNVKNNSTIQNILSSLYKIGIKKYIISESGKESVELFFIKKTLDMRRINKVRKYDVKVFRDVEADDKRMLGEANCIISPLMSINEIEETLRSSYLAASFAPNPYFELPKPVKEPHINMDSTLSLHSLEDNARMIGEAIFKYDTESDAFVNSAEVFVVKSDEKVISSEGTEISYTKYNVNGEFVVQCITPQDVEMHHTYSYNNLDATEISEKVRAAINSVRDRAKANSAPANGVYDIILTDDKIEEMLSYYKIRSNAKMIYAKYSTYKVGTNVHGDCCTGEKINMMLKATVPFTSEGIKSIDRKLIQNGVIETIYGNNRFSQYLGIEPTGDYSCIELNNGSVNFEDMKKGKVLQLVSFSDFQLNTMSGDFGGEIRLAYLYENGIKTILTGGSINGNIIAAQKNMLFSKEKYKDSHYEGPYALKLFGINVAGI